jgi:hypothetical protein
LLEAWSGPPPPNGVMHLQSVEFYRLWSVLQFSFCVPTGTELNSKTMFGEGLQWGGLGLVYLASQARRFEAMDFVYHILKIAAEDPKASTSRMGNVNMSDFLELAHYHRQLNDRILNLLRIHLPEVEQVTASNLIVCHPPSLDRPEGKQMFLLCSAATDWRVMQSDRWMGTWCAH